MIVSTVLSLLLGLSPAEEKECKEAYDSGKTQSVAKVMPSLPSHPVMGPLLKDAVVVRAGEDPMGRPGETALLAFPKRSASSVSLSMPLEAPWSGRTDVKLPGGFWCTELRITTSTGEERMVFEVPNGASVRAVVTRQGKSVLDHSVEIYRLGAVELERSTNLLAYGKLPPNVDPDKVWPPKGALLLPVKRSGPSNPDDSCAAVFALSMTFPKAPFEDKECMERLKAALAQQAPPPKPASNSTSETAPESGEICTERRDDYQELCLSYSRSKDLPEVLWLNTEASLPPGSTVRLKVGNQQVGTSVTGNKRRDTQLETHRLSMPWTGCTVPAGRHELKAEALDGQGKILHALRLPVQVNAPEQPPVLRASTTDSGVQLQWASCGTGAQDTLYWSQTPEVGETSQQLAGARSPYLHKVPLDGAARFYRIASRRQGKVLWSNTVRVEPSPRVCTQVGWCMELPRTFLPNSIQSVWGSSRDDLWAVGEQSAFHWDGQRWTLTLMPQQLLSVSGSATNDVWAVGGRGEFAFHWDGRSWSPVPLPEEAVLSGVWVASSTEAWGVGHGGIVLRWNGTTWSKQEVPATERLTAVWGSKPGDVWAVGLNGAALHWNGNAWQQIPTGTGNALHAVGGSGEQDVWAVGDLGVILHWDGKRWSAVPSPTKESIRQVSAWSPKGARAFTDVGAVLAWDGQQWKTEFSSSTSARGDTMWSTVAFWSPSAEVAWAFGDTLIRWDGNRWSESRPAESLPELNDLSVLPDGTAWAVGTYSKLYFWNGTGWEERTATPAGLDGSEAPLSAVWAVGPRHVFAGSPEGQILQQDGTSWQRVQLAYPGTPIYDIWGSAPDAVWAVAGDRSIYFWNGTSWSRVLKTDTQQEYVQAVSGSSRKDVWVVGGKGAVWHWNGAAWTRIPTETDADLTAVSVNGKEVWVVGWEGHVLQRSAKGWRRHELPAGIHLTKIWVGGPRDVWVTSFEGDVLHWDGQSWSRSSMPLKRSTGKRLAGLAGAGKKLWLVGASGQIFVQEPRR